MREERGGRGKRGERKEEGGGGRGERGRGGGGGGEGGEKERVSRRDGRPFQVEADLCCPFIPSIMNRVRKRNTLPSTPPYLVERLQGEVNGRTSRGKGQVLLGDSLHFSHHYVCLFHFLLNLCGFLLQALQLCYDPKRQVDEESFAWGKTH